MAKWIEKQYQTSPLGAVVEDSMTSGSKINAPSINAVQNAFSNPNLLINSDFRNPINQRGQTTYNSPTSKIVYTIDRWKILNKRAVLNVCDGYIELTNTFNDSDCGYFNQHFEDGIVVNDYLTLSVNVKNVTGNVKLSLAYFLEDGSVANNEITLTNGLNVVTSNIPAHGLHNVSFKPSYGAVAQLYWCKLEQGLIATPFVPRLYCEELLLCKRYFQHLMIPENNPYYDNSYFSGMAFEIHMRTEPSIYSQYYKQVSTDITNDLKLVSSNRYGIAAIVFNSAHTTMNGSIQLDAEIY